jgi:hypothetical protein
MEGGNDATANLVLGTRDLGGGGLEVLTVRETNWRRGHGIRALYLQGQLAGRRRETNSPSCWRPRPGATRSAVGDVTDFAHQHRRFRREGL